MEDSHNEGHHYEGTEAYGYENYDGTVTESQMESKMEDPLYVLNLVEKNEKINEAVPEDIILES